MTVPAAIEWAAPAAIEGTASTDPATLAETFGTPLYVYDLDVVESRARALRAALPSAVDVAYAVKANPSLAIVAFLGSLGLGADVASGGELETVVRAGIDPSRAVVTGPGKRDDELTAAVAAGVRAITVESLGELDRLERIARAAERRVPILVRANAVGAASSERTRIIGDAGAGKFGMDRDDLGRAARQAARSPVLDLLGIHAFGASNVLDADALVAHARATVALARALAVEAGFSLRLVDVGGGLGIPYRDDEAPLDLSHLGRGFADLVACLATDPLTSQTHLLLEPGRFLVGPAGVYLASVVATKAVDGSAVAILDGGINHVLRPALVRTPHRVSVLSRSPAMERRRAASTTIAGPLCTGLDIIATVAAGSGPVVGDLVAVLDVGAYGFTESMPLFLSHPTPAEVAVRGGQAALIRPRIEPSELLDPQIVPTWRATA